ncbi:unnamed protein product [Gadus morhua 'NCC']
MLKALPDMFSSPVVPPKRLGHASEAMLHVLEPQPLVSCFQPLPPGPSYQPPPALRTLRVGMSPVRASTPVQHLDSSDECGLGDVLDSQKSQARHFKTLQEMCWSKKPRKASVTHLLNLEFQVLDELQRIIQPNNAHYISEMRKRWDDFYSKVQFYGVMKKVMKPPKKLDGVEHATAVFRALPLLFPSSTMPPEKMGASSEAVFHVHTASEDPDAYLRQRPLSCPVLLVYEDNCMIAIGNTPVTTLDRKKFHEGLLYLLGRTRDPPMGTGQLRSPSLLWAQGCHDRMYPVREG